MANRTFFDVQSSNREVKIIATKVKIGTKPAATAVLTDASGTDVATNGIDSVVWGTGTGGAGADDKFKITLQDKYEALLSVHATKGNDAGGFTPALIQEISEDVATNKTITFDIDGALATTDEVYVTMFLLNTSVTK